MIVNESFLDSATLRENVVSLAGNIGYLPRSRTASTAIISFNVTTTSDSPTLTLKAGLVCSSPSIDENNNSRFNFAIPEDITVNVINGLASFENILIYQGIFLLKQFEYDGSLDQRFILNNSFIDTSTLRVYVKKSSNSGFGIEYYPSEDIFDVNKNSRIYFVNEVQDEKYELKFGDGIIGKKLGDSVGSDGTLINATYITTDGIEGNGASSFSFIGSIEDSNQNTISTGPIIVQTSQSSFNGSNIEPIDSIKYYAPKLYSAQFRAVTSRDYETIIKRIYPDTESVSVVGGQELDPPEFGNVQISIKPKNGSFISDFNKSEILSKLKQFSVSGINQKIVDLKILYVELNSSVYYNFSQTSNPESLKSSVINSIQKYSESDELNRFGGRFKYSKIQQVIDNTDTAITSNITKVTIRRDLQVVINKTSQYELCFGNRFNVKPQGYNIKSTGFKILGEGSTVYITDTPNIESGNTFLERTASLNTKTGIISLIKFDINGNVVIVSKNAGTVDYEKGEINIETITITETSVTNNVIEIQAFPESNDVVGLRDLYISLNVSRSTINTLRDVIASGDEISGTRFVNDFYTSSYSNGNLIRK